MSSFWRFASLAVPVFAMLAKPTRSHILCGLLSGFYQAASGFCLSTAMAQGLRLHRQPIGKGAPLLVALQDAATRSCDLGCLLEQVLVGEIDRQANC